MGFLKKSVAPTESPFTATFIHIRSEKDDGKRGVFRADLPAEIIRNSVGKIEIQETEVKRASPNRFIGLLKILAPLHLIAAFTEAIPQGRADDRIILQR